MGSIESVGDRAPDDGGSVGAHGTVFRKSSRWDMASWGIIAFYLAFSVWFWYMYVIVLENSLTLDTVLLAGVWSITFFLGFYLLLTKHGPGELRMDLLGIHFSYRWHRRSTPWANVKKVSWRIRNEELEMEFHETPFGWWEQLRWMDIIHSLAKHDCILMDVDQWPLEDLREMAEMARRMLAQEEVGDAPPEY